jgi:hypothetical protein|nr:MAG TPA: hypothetical protein [Caudoviricetes sp.]
MNPLLIYNITINNVNCAANLIDIDYLQFIDGNKTHNCDYESY